MIIVLSAIVVCRWLNIVCWLLVVGVYTEMVGSFSSPLSSFG